MAATSNSTVADTRSSRAKRARAEVADPPDALLSGTPGADPNWRDWGNLTAGPAGMIAEQFLADDVAGYLRFRAVCGSWRRCTPSPHPHPHHVLDTRFHPRRWIMLPEVFTARATRRDFLNVWTGERMCVDIPELRSQFVIGPTAEGLILLCQNRTGAVCLLNPLTRQVTTLPNAAWLLRNRNYRWKSSTGQSTLKTLQAQGFSAGLADSSTVAMHFGGREPQLAMAKPGDERWRLRAPSYYSIMEFLNFFLAALSFANRFYCATWRGINVVDATDGCQRLQVAVEDFRWQYGQMNLVDNDGELLVVRPRGRSIHQPYDVHWYDVHRVDLDAGEMVPVRGLRGRAVFVSDRGAGRGRSLSVHAGLCSSIKADTIYRCRSESVDRPPRIDIFLVAVGWIEIDFVVPSGSIVDCLSRYVCYSTDIVVTGPVPRHAVRKAAAGPRKRKRTAYLKVIGN